MTLPKLNLIPDQAGYTVSDPDGAVLWAKVGAGPARQRLDMFGAPSTLGVAFSLNPGQYQYWRAFFRNAISDGSLPFLIDLIIEGADIVEHEARIVPGSVRLSALSGLRYSVEAQLEAKALDRDTTYDSTLVWLYEEYGEENGDLLAALASLVNEHLPA